MTMILKKLIVLLLLSVAFSACSKNPDCMVADSVQEIENVPLNAKGLHLYLRTSGFNEKEHFYELFRGNPSFDECGTTTTVNLSRAHVDTTLGTPEKIIIKNNTIDIEYRANQVSEKLNKVTIVTD